MHNFLEQYGKAIFVLVLIAILIAFANPLGTKIKTATTEKVNQTTEIADDETYVARTGRPKPPKTAVDQVYCIYYSDGELVISQNQIEPESGRTVKTQGFYNYPSDCTNQMTTVQFEGAVMPKSCELWFVNCFKLTEIKNIKNLYTNESTSMYDMFLYCKSLKSIDLKNFDTSKVTTMKNMFYGCYNLKYLDLSSFDISKSQNCDYMMDTGTSTTIKANPDLKAKFNTQNNTKITWE